MDFLSELQGLSGENLCSATLRLLLIQSQELSARLVGMISRQNPSWRIAPGGNSSCSIEEATEDSVRWGRLDLCLETIDAVIGLETKLYSGLQKGYLSELLNTASDQANALASDRNIQYRGLVAVLAPSSRKTEIEELTGGNAGFAVLSWEEILDNFARTEGLDIETDVLLDAFDAYVFRHVSLFPEWDQWMPNILQEFQHGGTSLQRTVAARVLHFFPDPWERLSSGPSWCGYYFTDRTLNTRGWYGFIASEAIEQGAENEVEFIIALSFNVQFDENAFHEIQLQAGPSFLGSDEIYSWAIKLDDSWSQPDTWMCSIKPLFEACWSIRNGSEPESN